jgi:hypothetical protein
VEKLKKELNKLINRLQNSKSFRAALEGLVPVYPFSEYEYIISHLFAADKLTLEEYYELRNSYIKRNLYLPLFEISAPRGFGDKWALGHLLQIVPEFKMASKELDKNYSNDYDLWLDLPDKTHKHTGIRIEVKASRAVDFEKPEEYLYIKALAIDSNRPFDMNFQQIKPKCADVFLWIAVWRDKIRYWVLNSDELQKNKYFSKGQHRGNVGEEQLHLNQKNISDFDRYETKSTNIKQSIIEAYIRLKKLR